MDKSTAKANVLKRTVKLLAEEGAIEILIFIEKHSTARYKELLDVVKSQTTLTRRLEEFTSLEFLERRILNEKYRPTQYRLTERGRGLIHALNEIRKRVQ